MFFDKNYQETKLNGVHAEGFRKRKKIDSIQDVLNDLKKQQLNKGADYLQVSIS